MVFSGGRPASDQDRREQPESGSLSWGIIFLGLIGAATSTVALRLRPGSSSSGSGSDASSTRRNLGEQAWKRYNARMHAEYEDEMERMERIRRMQSVFNRERAKRMKAYESWQDQGPSGYQHCPRNDWYWEADTSFKKRERTILEHHQSS
ncbi:hypothetical protein HPP92_028670 [Vanilla planifolia]|uniref:Uncharacterized protein n=1 Tax=Vanilla planifolia TaxID=51239 RepID=A0A835U5E4_VANPL|nr:hypothetical protein HPP92_028670 [Vanilla planifolia]